VLTAVPAPRFFFLTKSPEVRAIRVKGAEIGLFVLRMTWEE